jgi:hypothetical protein
MASQSLTPEDRSIRARAAAYAKHAKHDPLPTVKKGQQGLVASFEAKVDPGNELPPRERARRAEMAYRAHMTSLAYKSARARRKTAKSTEGANAP